MNQWEGQWRVFAIVIFILLFSAFPVASGEVVFDEWVVAEQPFMIEGKEAVADYLKVKNLARVDALFGYFSLEFNECEDGEEFRICFVEFDDTTRAKFENGKEYPAMKLRIERLEPVISISRSLSEQTIDFGARADVTVTLTNEGDKPAFNVRYEDVMPAGISLVTSSGLERSGQSLTWEGVLSPHKSVSFSYVIEPIRFIEANTKATVKFFDGKETQTIKSDEMSIAVSLPFDIDEEFVPEEFNINDEVTYKVKLKKSFKRDLEISHFDLYVPKGMHVVKAKGWKEQEAGKRYSFSGTVHDDESFELTFRIPQKGSYDLKTVLSLNVEGEEFTKETTKPIRLGVAQLVPSITIDPSVVHAGQKYRVTAMIENIANKDIRANIAFQGQAMSQDGIRKTDEYFRRDDETEVFDKTLLAPITSQKKTYRFMLEGQYEDENNEAFSFSEESILTVEPIADALSLTVLPDHTSIAKEGKLQVKVFAKNLHTTELNAEVIDLLPKGINIADGKTSKSASLAAGEEQLLYTYTLELLDNFQESIITIKTVANADLSDGTLYNTEALTHVLVGEDVRNEEFDQASEHEKSKEQEDIESTDGTEGTETEGTEGTTPLLNEETGEPTTVALEEPDETNHGFFSKIFGWFAKLWN